MARLLLEPLQSLDILKGTAGRPLVWLNLATAVDLILMALELHAPHQLISHFLLLYTQVIFLFFFRDQAGVRPRLLPL